MYALLYIISVEPIRQRNASSAHQIEVRHYYYSGGPNQCGC